MSAAATQLELHALVAKFANSFDLKDWQALGECLADSVYVDYSELRGTPAETLTREQFVAPRREGMVNLKTHHLAGNIESKIEGSHADLKVSMMVVIVKPDGERISAHCVYFMNAARGDGGWRFVDIRQKVLIK
jgi:hypothetical protein